MNHTDETGIVLVPHTHWDREWYEPFQVFRFQLVRMFDEVLKTAEADAGFRFTLDGQTAAIDDYLEIRPENRERVKAMVSRGQLALGPWQILLDEFLCSGETIIRNLQMGISGAQALGGYMKVGYLPDMFGHVAQMPQILRSAGIGHACLWRGVPSAVTGHSFRWEAPDGSAVRVEYLFDGYGSALDLLAIPENIPHALAEYRTMTAQRYDRDPVLGMVGTDHMAPDPMLMNWVGAYDSPQFPIRVGTLEEYVGRFDPDEPLPAVRGELRSHARGNILPGVFSIRRNLKTAMAVAERMVTEAERLAATHTRSDFEPFVSMSWRRIIESTAHDSVVGSGTDETVDQVDARLREAAQIARAVRDEVTRSIAENVSSDSYLAVNTLPTGRNLMVELEVPAPQQDIPVVAEASDGTILVVQETGHAPTMLGDEAMDSSILIERIMNRIHGRELFGQQIETYRIAPHTLDFDVAEVPSADVFDITALRADLENAIEVHPGEWKVRITAQPRRRVLVDVPVPAMGTTPFRVYQAQRPAQAGVTYEDGLLRNGLVTAEVGHDGTVTLTGTDGTLLTGLGKLVDGGDCGDSYNYGPPASDVLVEEPSQTWVDVVETGPVRAVLRVTRHYQWPRALNRHTGCRATDVIDVPVSMLVELRRGEPFVRLRLQFINEVSDHRLRIHIPLPGDVQESAAEGQFSITARGLDAEGGGGEYPLPTFPAYSFVSAGPATVLVHDATEYEIVGRNEIALTVLRAVGSISVNVHPLRDEPAASEIPIPGAQEQGTGIDIEFAVMASSAGYRNADSIRFSDHFNASALSVRGRGRDGIGLPPASEGLKLRGENVRMSSLRPVDDGVEVRVVLLSDEATSAVLEGDFDRTTTVDLTGRILSSAQADGEYKFTLAPWEIRTLILRTAGTASRAHE
jgi:alpha-mannosidase